MFFHALDMLNEFSQDAIATEKGIVSQLFMMMMVIMINLYT